MFVSLCPSAPLLQATLELHALVVQRVVVRGCSGMRLNSPLCLSPLAGLARRMAPRQKHPFYDQEKAAFEADPTNAVIVRLGKEGDDGFLGLVKDIVRDAGAMVSPGTSFRVSAPR